MTEETPFVKLLQYQQPNANIEYILWTHMIWTFHTLTHFQQGYQVGIIISWISQFSAGALCRAGFWAEEACPLSILHNGCHPWRLFHKATLQGCFSYSTHTKAHWSLQQGGNKLWPKRGKMKTSAFHCFRNLTMTIINFSGMVVCQATLSTALRIWFIRWLTLFF